MTAYKASRNWSGGSPAFGSSPWDDSTLKVQNEMGVLTVAGGVDDRAEGICQPSWAPDGRTLSKIPRDTESWSWKAVSADRLETGEVLETLGTNNYVSRAYAKKVKPKNPGDLDFDPNTVIDFHAAYYTGMIDTVPRQFADVDEAICATQVDESTEVTETCDGTLDHIAFLEFGKQAGFLLGTPFFLCFAFAEDQTRY